MHGFGRARDVYMFIRLCLMTISVYTPTYYDVYWFIRTTMEKGLQMLGKQCMVVHELKYLYGSHYCRSQALFLYYSQQDKKYLCPTNFNIEIGLGDEAIVSHATVSLLHIFNNNIFNLVIGYQLHVDAGSHVTLPLSRDLVHYKWCYNTSIQTLKLILILISILHTAI